MRIGLMLQPSSVQSAHPPLSSGRHLWALLSSVLLGLTVSWAETGLTQTEPPAATTAPAELVEVINAIDAAATAGEVETVMQFYSPSFSSSDGLTYENLPTMLTELWQRYPNLTYKTVINQWQREGSAIIAETTTTITGTHSNSGRDLNLNAVLTSRQRFENRQIVAQEILDERSQITAGKNPPTLQVNLPKQVVSGQQFDFDAIVEEPLGDRLLLGAAIEEPIGIENYLNPAPIELELLSSGGLFKVGRAPAELGERWISAIIVRYDGITAVTQRLRVVGRETSTGAR